jgi:ABC-type polysaccharide/polyol phosphate transport system ATPase subunit
MRWLTVPDDSYAFQLDGVSVRYQMRLDPHLTLKEAIVRRRRGQVVEHLALDDVSLTVAHGETLGVIGRNGAGKTTMLNVMARVIQPTAGRLRIRGTVSPIIDLFGGFHPELTGRENVLLRGAFLGMNRAAMQARVPAITDFAEIGRFFDAPLRTYSAGMVVRLAFAVATSIDADIHLIDEALGVGDAEFQVKCAARMQEHRARGATFVIVTHDVQRLASMSDRMLWLDAGRIRATGKPEDIIGQYASAVQTPHEVLAALPT